MRIKYGFVALASIILISIPNVAFAQSKRINGNAWFGCLSRETHASIASMAASGDTEAFTRALRRAIVAGDCIFFRDRQEVHVTDTGFLSGVIQVRPAGQTDAYWTNLEAVKSKR